MLLCGKKVLDVVCFLNLHLHERGVALQHWAGRQIYESSTTIYHTDQCIDYLLLLLTSIALSASSTFRLLNTVR